MFEKQIDEIDLENIDKKRLKILNQDIIKFNIDIDPEKAARLDYAMRRVMGLSE
jgi:hypothetical protein